jgi:hypothetical protein
MFPDRSFDRNSRRLGSHRKFLLDVCLTFDLVKQCSPHELSDSQRVLQISFRMSGLWLVVANTWFLVSGFRYLVADIDFLMFGRW